MSISWLNQMIVMMQMILSSIIAAIGAYLIGSIPTGFLVAKLAGIADIRKHGSGNIGATNVARILGLHGFFIVLCIDALKAYGYVSLMQHLGAQEQCLAAIALLLLCGNIYSVFLEFRGGKGVATSVGIVAVLMPGVFLYILAIWFLILALTKTVGIASVVGSISLPLLASYHYGFTHVYALLSIAIAASLLVTHRLNLVRFFQSLSF
jgi:acyl phosphate:glycerol-3-phosphate acyltransferase